MRMIIPTVTWGRRGQHSRTLDYAPPNIPIEVTDDVAALKIANGSAIAAPEKPQVVEVPLQEKPPAIAAPVPRKQKPHKR